MDTWKLMEYTLAKKTASVVYKNARFFNVYTGMYEVADIAVEDGYIVGIGSYDGKENRELQGNVVPGYIDTHLHIESSLVLPEAFSYIVGRRGVTTAIVDPHEIANVEGLDGIWRMLTDAQKACIDIRMNIPSCVPSTSFEQAGATLLAQDLVSLYDEERIHGLAEIMNFPGVLSKDPDLVQKINDAKARGKHMDGHAPLLSGKELQGYLIHGIRTDHECETIESAQERVKNGMYVLIREGTAARNLDAVIHAVTPENYRRFCFCTDDRHLDDLVYEGSIDFCVRKALEHGLTEHQAITMATLNAAEAFGLDDRGALAVGKRADFNVVDAEYNVIETYVSGERIGELIHRENVKHVKVEPLPIFPEKYVFTPETKDATMHVIQLCEGRLFSEDLCIEVPDDMEAYAKAHGLLKMAVLERHNGTGDYDVCYVSGFQFTKGALATSITHDSHNIIVVGADEDDMRYAVETLKHSGGGIVSVCDLNVQAQLELEVGGLMTHAPVDQILVKLEELHESLHHLGFTGTFNPFLTLSFLALPVIPDVKLTPKGVYSVLRDEFYSYRKK